MDDFTEDWYKFIDIASTVDNTIITDTEGNDKIYNTGSNVVINALEGDNTISNGSYILHWDGLGVYFDGDISKGSKVTINSGSGSDSIGNTGAEVVVNAGDGNNYVDNNCFGNLIITGNGDDSIYSESGYSYVVDDPIITTINSGAGNDKIYAYGTTFLIDAGEGNDTIDAEYMIQDGTAIYGGNGNDSIEIEGNYNVSWNDKNTVVSNDNSLYINFGPDSPHIVEFTFDKENVYSRYDNSDSGSHSFYFYAVNVTVDGGADNDTINVYKHSKDMLINGGEGEDSISVGFSGFNSSNTVPTAINDTIQASEGNDTVEVFGVQALIDAGNGNDYIYACGTSDSTIRAGSGNDIISSVSRNRNSSNTFIDAGNGNNHINVSGDYDYDEKYVYSNSNVTILGGNDSDTIGIFDATNVSINSGAGDDLIGTSLSGYTNLGVATIRAGSGNDTIYGYDRGDGNLFRIVYQYSTGDGNDLIYY